jgi:IclR family transcriptional regulator, KDG regulon repressor
MEKTAAKAFGVLETLASTPNGFGVTALGRKLGLTKSNVHRLLASLVTLGYARKRDDGAYEATLRLWEIGVRVLNRIDLKAVARAHLEALAGRTDETVHLTVLDRGEILYVDKIESRHPVREFTRVGDRAPAHCTATGKSLLALRNELPGERKLPSFTRNTIRDVNRLKIELDRIRQQGYALNLGEYGANVNGVAAPIVDHEATPIASVAVSGPAERIKPAMLRSYAPLVLGTARAISSALGYRGALAGWDQARTP